MEPTLSAIRLVLTLDTESRRIVASDQLLRDGSLKHVEIDWALLAQQAALLGGLDAGSVGGSAGPQLGPLTITVSIGAGTPAGPVVSSLPVNVPLPTPEGGIGFRTNLSSGPLIPNPGRLGRTGPMWNRDIIYGADLTIAGVVDLDEGLAEDLKVPDL